jgi:hypothetical protein
MTFVLILICKNQVERNESHSFNAVLAAQIEKSTGRAARRVALDQITPELLQAHRNVHVIATIELEDPLLSRVTEDEMRLVKILTDSCANLVWVTGGRLLQGSRPELWIVFGLSRALMLEQPSLRFFVVDVDLDAKSPPADIDITAVHVLDVLRQAVEEPEPDFEFIHDVGVLHVSRFVPAETLNSTFREKQGAEKKTLTLGEAQPFRLDIETVGQTDSIFFRREEATAETPLAADHIEVLVKAIGLSTRVSYDDGQRMRAVANRVKLLCRTFKPSAVMLRTAAARPARLSTVLWSRELAMV